ncbi:endo alpha-1,4 polygalactosaminidase [Mycobacterium sp. WMMD1722]|uniref:endo alpha-1,4 polygalactosaminidase n=1 Tax=Mycobacterium sp. WMMD1722 TaxID=3404117 RepID=UPI003BF484B4
MTKAEPAPRLPSLRAGFDYQLGGAYPPPPGVATVERDRTAAPAGAGYDICYVNGFQTQPDESASFAADHPDLVVRDGGEPVTDPGWPDEYLFDTSTETHRTALAAIVGPWIAGCASAGYDAVEFDNLDSFTRAPGALTAEDNIALATVYAELAHQAGLAVAQKNTVEHAGALRAAGYDFAIAESCAHYGECSGYTAHYPVVLDIEYSDELGATGFATACTSPDRAPVMILRDLDLLTPADPGYVYRDCSHLG